MPYAYMENMCERFGPEVLAQLAPPDHPDPGGSFGPCEPAILAALEDASQTVDAYAAARYRTPLNPVPGPVIRWTCDIARWYLDRSRTDKAIRQAYEDAIKGLEAMSKGQITFACDGVESAPAPGGQVLTAGPARFYDAKGLRSF